MTRLRALALAPVALLLLVELAAPAASVGGVTLRKNFLVLDATANDVLGVGGEVIDEYGPFTTARLTAAQETALSTQGFLYLPLNHSTGRGAHVGIYPGAASAIPEDLRAPADTPYALVQFRGPVKAAWAATLATHALAVYDYLPNDAYLVRLDDAGRAALAALPEVRAIVPWHPAFKLAADFPATGTVEVRLMVYRDADLATARAAIEAIGANVWASGTTTREHVVGATVDAGLLDDLARIAYVLTVEPEPGTIEFDNAAGSAILQGGTLGEYPLHDRGVDGSTQLLSVCDGGVYNDAPSLAPPDTIARMLHEAFDDIADGRVQMNEDTVGNPASIPPHRKIALYYAPRDPTTGIYLGDVEGSGHGTKTASTLAGDAPPYGIRNGNDGIAFASRLVICDLLDNVKSSLPDTTIYYEQAYAAGARVSSNSWGGTWSEAYTLAARQLDGYLRERPDFVMTRSLGNIENPPRGPRIDIDPGARPEAGAKNVLAVGGSSGEAVWSGSPTGRMMDGRIKPNVVAPAVVTTASSGTSSYEVEGGTSYSTPMVAGAAGLVRDYFAKGFYPTGAANPSDAATPSAALVRAILQSSGREMSDGSASFPNSQQGWGRVTLDDALYFAGDARKLLVVDDASGLRTGDVFSIGVTVSSAAPLRVFVAWTDAPALPYAPRALVNDLNLRVDGEGHAYVGNALANGESSDGAPAPDAVNVEEAVYVASPTPGAYTIRVQGLNVPFGPQPFALVVLGDVAWTNGGTGTVTPGK